MAVQRTGATESQHRVVFDFEIEFANGGGMTGEGFRLDIEGEDVADDELADYLVQDMRLLMVRSVRILKKAIISEPHRRAPATAIPPVILDVSHIVEDGFVLPATGFLFFAVPVKVRGCGTFPARAFAVLGR